MKLDFKIEGINQTVAKIKILQEEVRDEIGRSMGRACTIIETQAKTNITEVEWTTKSGIYRGMGIKKTYYPAGSTLIGHVQTGNLRRSIKSKWGFTSQFEIVGVIGTDVPYAPYVEALPDGGFLFPALIKAGPQAVDYLKDEIKKAIKKV